MSITSLFNSLFMGYLGLVASLSQTAAAPEPLVDEKPARKSKKRNNEN